jgi:SAM-dependent methyltransferase
MKQFTHVSGFTEYMSIVQKIVLSQDKKNLKILDMPAGNGLLSENLREHGHEVTCADINSEKPEYTFVNMEHLLPFEDATFDAVICLEGIEHVISPDQLVKEICRVVRPDGFIIISLPNVQSLFSRLKFLFTGTFYQFEPESTRHPKGELMDRGHISPLSFFQLSYLFGEYEFIPKVVTGDKIKKKVLMPLYLILLLISNINGWLRCRKNKDIKTKQIYKLSNQLRAQTSRSLVTLWTK